MKKANFLLPLKAAFLFLALVFLPFLAQAHPGLPGHTHGFVSGLSHPLSGLDHILAMVAVGLWASQLGGRSLWLVPAAFVSVMILGGFLGMAGIQVPMVETGILVSVLVLGLLIAAAVRLPMAASLAVVGLFALFHGHAHGTELPASASGLAYGIGFVIATILLHACGIGLGLVAQKKLPAVAIRYAGAAIVLAGICLCIAP